MSSLPAVVDSVLQTIGRTPLVRLQRLAPGGSADVFVKLEYFNPTGSYKDRMALAMIEGAERRGELRPGMCVVLNLVGALQLARELGPGKVVATVAVDTGLKYLAGDLYK
jgi:cysteine synthase